MELKEYSKAVKRTLPDLGNIKVNNIHMVLGMVTEVAELADAHKKNIAYKKEVDAINIEEEIGNILWYLVNYCNINNINIEKCMGKNIQKLYIRYPEKFSEDKDLVRDIEKEILSLEKD